MCALSTEIPAVPQVAVPQVVAAVAARHPSVVAVETSDATLWTYATLLDRSRRVAASLRGAGVAPGDVVGLWTSRTPSWVAGVLGVVASGAVYLPLDPALPLARLRSMLDVATPALVLAEGDVDAVRRRIGGRRVLALDDALAGAVDAAPFGDQESAPPRLAPESPAYLLFTSGSTGAPKGCLLPHRGWANLARVQRDRFGLGPGDRVLQAAPLHFDASIWELSMALGAGATLVLPPPGTTGMLDALRALDDLDVTAVTLTPSVLATLRPEALPRLHTVVAAGEACPTDLAHRWADGRRVFNAYGPTEATVCATMHRVRRGTPVTIGTPLPGVRVYVLDDDGRACPDGVNGELYIGGAGVGLGYVGRPDRSAERFVPDPFDGGPGACLYRTGDRGRRLASGAFEFLGRVDRQVQVRGRRVEPAEVEAALCAHPAVDRAVVTVARPGTPAAALVAHVTPSDPRPDVPPVDLSDALAERLPSHLVPDRIVWSEALPIAANGKVDADALAAPDPAACDTERVVARVWTDVLGTPPPDATTNVFACGATSLLVADLAARLQDVLDVAVPTRAVYDHSTVAALAAHLDAARAAAPSADDAAPIAPVDWSSFRSS